MSYVDLRIPHKMAVAFALPILVFSAIGLTNWFNTDAISRSTRANAGSYRRLILLNQAITALIEEQNAVRGYAATLDTTFLFRRQGFHDDYVRSFSALNAAIDNPGERSLTDQFAADVEEFETESRQLISDVDAGRSRVRLRSEVKSLGRLTEIRKIVKSLSDLELNEFKWRAAELERAISKSQLILALGRIAGAVFAIVLGWIITVATAKPIEEMARAMLRLAEGDHTVEIPAHGRRDEVGDMATAVAVFRDNAIEQASLREESERLRHEAEEERLQAERDRAASAAKSDFVANMSHEIRTPLTAILGFTALLVERRDLDAEAQGQISRVANAGKALLSVVNEVLDLSKLEAGQFEFAPKSVGPVEVLDDALSMFALQAKEKGLALKLEPDRRLPAFVLIDADRVRQILVNLIGNAIKFTDKGSVRLSATYDPGVEQLVIGVHDTGAGMNEAQRLRLFQRFSQVDAPMARRQGGTGLGLAICKSLSEAMGGEISVTSRPGRGSHFTVRVAAPVTAAPPRAEASHNEISIMGLRLLIADDHPVNRELARAILEPMGVELGEAVDGMSAIQAAAAAPYDLILMDVRMPGMGGPEAAAIIRGRKGPNRRTPILAFTADVDFAPLEDVGSDFNGVIRKPLVASELIGSLAHFSTKTTLDLELARLNS